MDLSKKVYDSPNFTYGEFVKSEIANRQGINNIPKSKRVWSNIEALTKNCLQPIRDRFGPVKILSGYRTPKLCLAIGSSIYSNHTRGEAADIRVLSKDYSIFQVFKWIIDNLEFRELILEYPLKNSWIHIAYRWKGNISAVKLKDEKHNYSRVDFEYIKSIYKV